MQFFAASAALFAALAVAAPTPAGVNPAHGSTAPNPNTYENIDIADLSVRKNSGIPNEVQAVSFKLTGKDATSLSCGANNLNLPSADVTCGETKYRFSISKGTTSEFALTIIHELGTAAGFYGEGDVPTYCHAGGVGADDFICAQTNPTTIVIDAHNE